MVCASLKERPGRFFLGVFGIEPRRAIIRERVSHRLIDLFLTLVPVS